MPKIIAHGLIGAAIVVAIHPKVSFKNLTPIFIGMLLAISPDLDLPFELLFDIRDLHRGFTHSLAFSFIIGLAIRLWMPNDHATAAYCFGLAYLSHLLLDMATSTSGGVKLLYPFSESYYNLGLTGVFELPIGTNLTEILAWCKIELLVFIPVFLIAVVFRYLLGYFIEALTADS